MRARGVTIGIITGITITIPSAISFTGLRTEGCGGDRQVPADVISTVAMR